jgi:divinyl protochlorophyllide a 8-vinyl-reductase
MLPVLDARAAGLGVRMLSAAGMDGPPPDHGLMPEGPAARLHQAVRRHLPDTAPAIAAAAGRRTADYILANRIPKPAQGLLRLLPPMLSGPLLSRAIAQNAWTFAGSGRFHQAGRLRFEIAANPLVAGERADQPLCAWHAAVFERLFRVLVDDRLRATETGCCACGDPACRFELTIPAKTPRQGTRNVSELIDSN